MRKDRRSKKERREFKDTGFGKFLKKAVKVLPELADVAMDIVGGPLDIGYDAIRNALSGNESPESQALLNEMKAMQLTWEIEMEKYHVQILQINASDRDSARNRENTYTEAGKRDLKQTVVLAIGLAAFVFSIVCTVFVVVPEANQQAWTHLMGVIEGAAAIPIFNYFFGSSDGSRRKTEIMSE